MKTFLLFLSGKKSYIIGVAMILTGLYKQDQQMILEGLGFITLRAGIAKIKE